MPIPVNIGTLTQWKYRKYNRNEFYLLGETLWTEKQNVELSNCKHLIGEMKLNKIITRIDDGIFRINF